MQNSYARAKINLSLIVREKLPSGFHLLETLICPISLADEIRCDFSSRPTESSDAASAATCSVSFSPELTLHLIANGKSPQELADSLAGPQNLAVKAAEIFLQRFIGPTAPRLEITLKKSIPLEAGLGGGSADAAAMLRILAAQFPQAANGAALIQLAGQLGSDVAAAFCERLVFAQGTGGDLRFVEPTDGGRVLSELQQCGLVVLKPGSGVPTAAAYRALNRAQISEAEAELRATAQNVSKIQPRTAQVFESLAVELDTGKNSGFNHLTSPHREGISGVPKWASASDLTLQHRLQSLVNDFEAVVFPEHPLTAQAASLLSGSGADRVLLAGSGSSVVGFYPSMPQAEAAASGLREKLSNDWFCVTAALNPT